MSDWNPTRYLQFEAERTRPANELAARVDFSQATAITDLGCGPGNSTAVLVKLAPRAAITGVDNSAAMLEKARNILPGCHFQTADIEQWQADSRQDVIFANASLQWVANHQVVFPRLVSQLAIEGQLAVQMPDNWHEPSHRLMREVAVEMGYPDRNRESILRADEYYDILTEAGCELDLWRTTYFHIMPSTESIIDWLSTTGLRRFLNHLPPAQQEKYLQRYRELIAENYPVQQDGKVIMPFPRLFILARRIR